MITATAGQAIVARYFEMWNNGDTSITEQILSPHWIDHDHPEVTGPADVSLAVAKVRGARPGLRFQITSLLGDGDLVAAVGQVETGGDTPASRLIWLIRLEDGLMAEMWTYSGGTT